MTQSNILGLVALVVGAALLIFAWSGTNAPVDQMTEALTGRFSGTTMWFMIAGLTGVVVGSALIIRDLLRP